MPRFPISTYALALALALLPSVAFAQGSLTPPGAPGATMRSLDQVEPRTPIPAAGPFPYTISTPGSYYLTGNVAVSIGNGIVIATSGVSLDLSGFTISSTAATRNSVGVYLNGDALSDIRIVNGNIRGTTTYSGATYSGGGFVTGITWNSGLNAPRNVRVDGVAVSGVGNGIALGATDPSNIVRGSVVSTVPGLGISAGTISDSAAVTTGSTSIQGVTVANSAGTTTGGGQTVISAKPTLESIATTTNGIAASTANLTTATNNLTATTNGIAATLAQDEPRTPITPTGPFPYVISTAGSYYLTGNITVASGDAIVISANDVTLDLNGFTLTSSSSTASGNAVNIGGGRSNLAIMNGNIRSGVTQSGGVFTTGPGFDGGINWPTGAPSNVRVSGVNIVGVARYGIDLGTDNTSVVQGCTVRVAALIGIRAGAISDSVATQTGTTGMTAARVANSACTPAASGTAIAASSPSLDAVSSTVQTTQSTVNATQTTVNAINSALGSVQTDVNNLSSRSPVAGGTAKQFINFPGSYYLTGNIAVSSGDAIEIAASNVTLDLNGFALVSSSATASGSGIVVTGTRTNIAIRNGTIAGTTTNGGGTSATFTGGGFYNGINASTAGNVLIERVQVTGVGGYGFYAQGTGVVFDSCSVLTTGQRGFDAPEGMLRNCSARRCLNSGISARVAENCFAESVSNVAGTYALFLGDTGTNCTGRGYNAASGAYVSVGHNCSGTTDANSGYGLNGFLLTGCNGASSGTANALGADTAVGCTFGGGTTFITRRYNMP